MSDPFAGSTWRDDRGVEVMNVSRAREILTARSADMEARIRALFPPQPVADQGGMVQHEGGWSHSLGLRCDRCPGFPHSSCVPMSALFALLDAAPAGGAE